MDFIQNASGRSYEDIHALGIVLAEDLFCITSERILATVASVDRLNYSTIYTHLKKNLNTKMLLYII